MSTDAASVAIVRIHPFSKEPIMQRLSCLLCTSLLASLLPGQAVIETFTFANGPTIPGWTQQRGTWAINNFRLAHTSGASWDYITKDGVSTKNSVLDVEVFYGGTGVQFGGLTARHPGGNLDNNLVMCKIQDNGGTPDLDRVFIYERGGAAGNTYADLVPGVQSAFIRMITLEANATMQIDKDKDGVFEQSVGPRALTTILGSGFVGLNAYQATELDNFEYFDAVLVPQSGSTPKIGTTFSMQLTTPAPQFTPYIAALSEKNTGIPFGSRAVPLGIDALLVASLGAGLGGLTGANGIATINLPIPNNPALVGYKFFAAALTLDGQQPFGLGAISNEHAIQIVQ